MTAFKPHLKLRLPLSVQFDCNANAKKTAIQSKFATKNQKKSTIEKLTCKFLPGIPNALVRKLGHELV